MTKWIYRTLCFVLAAGAPAAACAAASETAKADAARKKPLQRCDQLNQQAELDCLHKARERIIEARQKREKSSNAPAETPAKSAGENQTPPKDK